MPIYLDRHDTPEEITPEHVAEMHQADLKVQHKFGCRGFTYWFDDKRKSGFCLIEAPNKEALIKMHDHAHGAVPHQIIEVEENMVEAFLGRLEDPKKANNEKLNIIDEPAFRTIMSVIINVSSNKKEESKVQQIHDLNRLISHLTRDYKGRIVKNTSTSILSSFNSVSNAVDCVIKINEALNDKITMVNIGLNCGIPVTDKEGIFEDTITLAKRMACHAKGITVFSSEVMDLYSLENVNKEINLSKIEVLGPNEQQFLNSLMDFIEDKWTNTDLKVDDFAKNLGLSKSQVYRKLKTLSAKSPNTFIKDYRLNKALLILDKGSKTISEVAFETGFNSPSYFSKCFLEKYGISPSYYIKTEIN